MKVALDDAVVPASAVAATVDATGDTGAANDECGLC